MKNTRWIWPIMTLAVSLGVGYYFGGHFNEETKYIPIVKTYKIAPERTKEAKYALQNLFSGLDSASVGTLRGGVMVVRYPRSFEKGIDEMMHEFSSSEAVDSQKVKMDYWVVRGYKTGSAEVGKSLVPLKEALDSIKEADGPMSFQLVEHLTSQAEMGSSVKVKGMMESTLSPVSGKIRLGLRFETDFGKIETNTKIEDGQFLVVGQNGVKSKDLRRSQGAPYESVSKLEGTERLYYIIRGKLIE